MWWMHLFGIRKQCTDSDASLFDTAALFKFKFPYIRHTKEPHNTTMLLNSRFPLQVRFI